MSSIGNADKFFSKSLLKINIPTLVLTYFVLKNMFSFKSWDFQLYTQGNQPRYSLPKSNRIVKIQWVKSIETEL